MAKTLIILDQFDVMLRYLLDISIVSVPVWKEPDPRVVDWLNAAGPECTVATPVRHELICGCSRLPKGKRRSALQVYLRDVVRGSFPILPYDEASATWHGAERARLESSDRTPLFVDGQIAAIAHVHEQILVTANPRDFDAFLGLSIEDCSTWPRRGPKK